MNLKNEKLYIVEFGKPDSGGWTSFGGVDPMYVIAKSYDEAVSKALIQAELRSNNESNVLTYDGSLNVPQSDIKVKGVKLACEEIVY